jgi:thiol-disulfide isomerase/thioredoxin
MQKTKTSHISVWSIALVLIFLSAVVTQAATPMPSFALASVRDGKIVESDSFNGKVLLLTFFATWCPPCAEEVPVLVKLHKELADAGFSVIGLSVDQTGPASVAKFVKNRKINYPVLLAESRTTQDFGGVYGIPVAFLVNKSGNVVKKYTGYVQHEILERDIRSLLD